jgi:hypothetical protein
MNVKPLFLSLVFTGHSMEFMHWCMHPGATRLFNSPHEPEKEPTKAETYPRIWAAASGVMPSASGLQSDGYFGEW